MPLRPVGNVVAGGLGQAVLGSEDRWTLVAAPEFEILGAVNRWQWDVIVFENNDGRSQESDGEKGVHDEGRVECLETN